jgi:hypothetical protein
MPCACGKSSRGLICFARSDDESAGAPALSALIRRMMRHVAIHREREAMIAQLEPTPMAPSPELNFEEHLTSKDDAELLALWSSIMSELLSRGVLRSSNNPTGDYAEHLVASKLELTLQPNSTSGYDAVASDGTRFQIKGRRLMSFNASRQLGVLRNLDQDGFDYLVVVVFGPNFEVQEMWQFPIDLVREHAIFRKHVNGSILHARRALLSDPRAMQLV